MCLETAVKTFPDVRDSAFERARRGFLVGDANKVRPCLYLVPLHTLAWIWSDCLGFPHVTKNKMSFHPPAARICGTNLVFLAFDQKTV